MFIKTTHFEIELRRSHWFLDLPLLGQVAVEFNSGMRTSRWFETEKRNGERFIWIGRKDKPLYIIHSPSSWTPEQIESAE